MNHTIYSHLGFWEVVIGNLFRGLVGPLVSLVSETIGLLSKTFGSRWYEFSLAKKDKIFTRLVVPKIWSTWANTKAYCSVVIFAVNDGRLLSFLSTHLFLLSIFGFKELGIVNKIKLDCYSLIKIAYIGKVVGLRLLRKHVSLKNITTEICWTILKGIVSWLNTNSTNRDQKV